MEKSTGSSGRMMRSSRSPYLVIALLFVTGFLAFSYWGQTRKNGALTNELESLQIDFRAVSEKHLNKEKQVAEITTQFEEKKEKLIKMEAKVGETEKKLADSKKEVDSLKDQLKTAQEQAEAAKNDKEKAQKEKGDAAGELDKVKKELTDLKNSPPKCDKTACKDHVREVLKAMIDSVGKPPVNGALKKHNVDVMAIAGDLLEVSGSEKAADSPGAQIPMPGLESWTFETPETEVEWP